MTPIEAILRAPAQVHVAGDQALPDRRLGKHLRGLVKTGALSALLLVQAIQGVQASDMFEADPGATAPATEVGAQRPLPHGVELINPLENQSLPHNTLADTGINAFNVFHQWDIGDIAPDQMLQLSEVLMLTQSPVFVRTEESKRDVLALAKRTESILAVSNQAQAEAFLAKHSAEQLQEAGLIHQGAMMVNVREYKHSQKADVFQFWLAMGLLKDGGDASSVWLDPEATGEQYQASIEALKQTVGTTGLESLRVPLPMWTTPQQLQSLASELGKAEAEMQQVTGWQHEVLGLKGNVNLIVGVPFDVAIAAADGQGNLYLQAPIDLLGHEWGHGLDILLAKKAGYAPEGDGMDLLTYAIRDHRAHEFGDLASTWQRLHHSLHAQPNLVVAQDDEPAHSLLRDPRYFDRAEERLAFSLESFIQSKAGPASVLARADGVVTPGTADSQAMWETTFSSLQGWWDGMPAMNPAHGHPTHPKPGIRLADMTPSQEEGLRMEMPATNQWRNERAASELSASTGPLPARAPSL